MRSCQFFDWSPEHGNRLDIQCKDRFRTQARYHWAAIKLIRKFFMFEKPMGNRLGLHGETVLRNNNYFNDRLLPLSI
ncbi:hypothetical protein D3C76_704940 [compost metagenome]